MSLIINNTVLSNFASVGKLDILKKLYGKAYITLEVYEEVENGIRSGRKFLNLVKTAINEEWLSVIELNEDELTIFNEILEALDYGEASCIAIAKERKYSFLSDDKNARKIAERFKIKYNGTIGILSLAYNKGIISKKEANQILKDMIMNGYYSPISNLDDIL